MTSVYRQHPWISSCSNLFVTDTVWSVIEYSTIYCWLLFIVVFVDDSCPHSATYVLFVVTDTCPLLFWVPLSHFYCCLTLRWWFSYRTIVLWCRSSPSHSPSSSPLSTTIRLPSPSTAYLPSPSSTIVFPSKCSFHSADSSHTHTSGSVLTSPVHQLTSFPYLIDHSLI